MKKLERVLSMLMALVLMIGMTIPTVSAVGAEVGKETIKYVSLGDSMTNGYNLPGYYPITDDSNTSNVRGYRVEVANTYPTLFKDYLEKNYGCTVELDQLAVSGYRIQELRFLLEDEDYYGDWWTWNTFDDRNNGIDLDDIGNLSEENQEIIRKYFYWVDQYADTTGQYDGVGFGYGKQDSEGEQWFATVFRDPILSGVTEIGVAKENRADGVCDYLDDDTKWADYISQRTVAFEKFAADMGFKTGTKAYKEFYNTYFLKSTNEWLRYDYRTSIAEADVISMSFGSNDFGGFVRENLNNILSLIDAETGKYENWREVGNLATDDLLLSGGYILDDVLNQMDPEMKELYYDLRAQMLDAMNDAIASGDLALGSDVPLIVEDMVNVMMYAFAGYIVNYSRSMELIRELNPDAQIITIGMLNNMSGMTMTFPGIVDADGNSISLPIGDIYSLLVDAINVYMASYDAKDHIQSDLADALAALEAKLTETEDNEVIANVREQITDLKEKLTVSKLYPQDIFVDLPDTVHLVNDMIAEMDDGDVEPSYMYNYLTQYCTWWTTTDCGDGATTRHYDCPQHIVDWKMMETLAGDLGAFTPYCIDSYKTSFFKFTSTKNTLNTDLTYDLLYLLTCSKSDSRNSVLYDCTSNGSSYFGGDINAALECISTGQWENFMKNRENLAIGLRKAWLEYSEGKTHNCSDSERVLEGGCKVITLENGDKVCVTTMLAELYEGLRLCLIDAADEPEIEISAFFMDLEYMLRKLETFLGDAVETYMADPENVNFSELIHQGMFEGEDGKQIKSYLYWYTRLLAAEGMGMHPTNQGHQEMFEAIVEAWENNYTSSDYLSDLTLEKLQTIVSLITEYYDEAYAYGYQYAVDNGYIDKAVAGIDEAIAAVKGIDISNVEMTEAFRAQLNAELDAVVKTLEKAKAAVRSASTLDALKLAAQEMCDELNQHLLTVRALGEQAGTDVIELIVIPALEKAVEIVDTQLIPAVQEAIKQANAYLSAMLGQIYDEVVAKVTAIVGKYVPEAEAWINKWLNAGADMKAQLEELKAQLDSLRADLEKAIEEGKQELFDEIQKQIDQVVTEMESLIGKFVNSIFSANYVRKENSSYAAIVGNTDSYVAAVAELLGLDVKSMNWGALNLSTLATSDLITIGFDEAELYSFAVDQMLAYVAEYADEELRATLEAYMKNVLTKGTGNLLTDKQVKDSIAAVGTYLDQILADDLFADKTVQTLDWSAFLGKYTSYVDAARAKLYEALNENDIPTTYTLKINLIDYLEQMDVAEINWDTVRANLGDEAFCTVELPMADFADVFAESLLYGMISFNVQYAQTVQTITAVNPDAKILLLNHYNPISGLTLTVEDVTIELGEIYDVVANVASIHPLIYAVINDNVVYVDVQDTQTVFGQLVDFGVVDNTLENLVMTVVEYGNVLTASANGNAYIAQQIINALNITCGHWDNDNNHKCDNCGEVISECADTDNDHKCDVCGKVLSECVDSDGDYKCDICGKSVGTPETKPAETETTEPGTTKPTEPDTTKPTEPDTTEPTEPGTTEPTEPGTTEPTEPGTTEPTEPGTTEPTEPGTTEPTEPGTTEPTEPGTTEPTEPDTTPTEPVDPDDGLPTIAVIGIVAGSVVALGGIGYLLFFLFKKKII